MSTLKHHTRTMPRFALKKTRVQLEKLEDRVLLSAEPLVQLRSSDQPLVAEQVAFDLLERQAPLAAHNLNELVQSKKATVIQLKKGIEQDSRLQWADPSNNDLMKLSESVNQLVLDLGVGADQVRLSSTAEGMLRLSGEGIYDLLFAAPTQLVGLRGGSGVDQVLLENLNLGGVDMVVEAETIRLEQGKTLEGQGNYFLRGHDLLEETARVDISRELSANVRIDGIIKTSGSVVLDALAATQLRTAGSGESATVDLGLKSTAQAWVGSQAIVTAGSLAVRATTAHTLQATGMEGLGTVSLITNQSTQARVDAGATLVLGAQAGAPAHSLLVEALDRSAFSATMSANDGSVNLANGLGQAAVRLDITRDVQARLEGQYITVTDPDTQVKTQQRSVLGASGQVQVSAVTAEGAAGGSLAEVASSLTGRVDLKVSDTVLAQVKTLDLSPSALRIYALAQTPYSALGKDLRTQASGGVSALLLDAKVQAAQGTSVIAVDASQYRAISDGFVADSAIISGGLPALFIAGQSLERSVRLRLP